MDETLDIQHDTDPAEDHGPAHRIPHLGHTLLFLSLTVFFCSLCAILTVAILSSVAHISEEASARDHQIAMLMAQAEGYILTLAVSFWLFPRIWGRSFLHGIQWNVLALHRRWMWLLPAAVVLSGAAQFALHFIPSPDHVPVENLFTTARAAWATAAVSVLLGPLFEEITFRGFLLPALATAYDWLALERTPAGLEQWRNTTLHSRSALIFAAVISSIPFALLHAAQIGFVWGAVGVLYGVSLALSFVRIRTYSVACSTFLHATYNLTIFVIIYVSTHGFHNMEQFSRK
jgi:membrane protease YdiL (CAAX protease family)